MITTEIFMLKQQKLRFKKGDKLRLKKDYEKFLTSSYYPKNWLPTSGYLEDLSRSLLKHKDSFFIYEHSYKGLTAEPIVDYLIAVKYPPYKEDNWIVQYIPIWVFEKVEDND